MSDELIQETDKYKELNNNFSKRDLIHMYLNIEQQLAEAKEHSDQLIVMYENEITQLKAERNRDIELAERLMKQDRDLLRDRCARLEEALKEANDDMIWMSGSDDFNTDGKAHQQWIKVRERLFKRMAALVDEGQ